MDKRERVYAALEGQPVDRVPVTLWRRFHQEEQDPASLASATLAFYQKYNLDLIRLIPNKFYGVADWGAHVVPAKNDQTPAYIKKTVIQDPEDWRSLNTLHPDDGRYGQALETIKLIANQLGEDDAPFLVTVFSPLTLASQLAGEKLLQHIEGQSTDVHIGLATIAETTSRFAQAALDAGADGIFFVSEFSHTEVLTREQCESLVIRYDLIALDRVKIQPAPLVVHLAGGSPYFNTINQYPVHAVSWQSIEAHPTVEEGLTLTDKTALTGLSPQRIEEETPEDIRLYVRDLIERTQGERIILAPTTEVSNESPEENLQAIFEATQQTGSNQHGSNR